MTPQELKNSILQLAIQGKLVEQRVDEKPISLHSSLQFNEDSLYEIPESWRWFALKDVITVNTGLSFKKQDQLDGEHGTLRVLRGGNIGDDYRYHLYDNDVFVNYEQFQDKYIQLQEGDVITPSVTSMEKIGKTGYIDKTIKKTTAGGFVYIVRCIDNTIVCSKYLQYFINSSFNREQCKPNIHKSGQAFYNLKKSGFAEQPIPLPPLAEQKRIVAKIEELLPLIDRYEQAWGKLEAFYKRFPADMQKSILQMAIQGKLVEQRPEEGTGEELYQQIQAEKLKLIKAGKIKKEKPLADIAEDEVPFEIPESWRWIKLGEVASVLGGKRIPAGRQLTTENTGHKYIRVSDMKNGTVLTDGLLYVPEDIYPSIARYIINKEDIYITVAGTIGRVGKIPEELDGANLTENADRLVFVLINQDWLIKCLESNLIQNQIADATTKVGQPKLAIKRIQELYIPLPPLAEQKRIVAKLEELLPLCERLK